MSRFGATHQFPLESVARYIMPLCADVPNIDDASHYFRYLAGFVGLCAVQFLLATVDAIISRNIRDWVRSLRSLICNLPIVWMFAALVALAALVVLVVLVVG